MPLRYLKAKKKCSKRKKVARNTRSWQKTCGKPYPPSLNSPVVIQLFSEGEEGGRDSKASLGLKRDRQLKTIWCINRLNFKLICQQFQNTHQQFHQHQRLQIHQQHLHQLLNRREGTFLMSGLAHQQRKLNTLMPVQSCNVLLIIPHYTAKLASGQDEANTEF